MSQPSLKWQKLQDVYYSIKPCYNSMEWDVEDLHSNYKVVVSSNCTLMGLSPKAVAFYNIIDIYNMRGKKLWSMVYNSSPFDHIVDYCFRGEQLCVLLSNRKFRFYSDFKGNFNEYFYDQNCIFLENVSEVSWPHSSNDSQKENLTAYEVINLENENIEEVYQVRFMNVWSNFLVLVTLDGIIIAHLETFCNYKIRLSRNQASDIHCVNALSVDKDSLTLLLSYGKTILSLWVDLKTNSFTILDNGLTEGPFDQVSCSPNGNLIAIFNSEVKNIFVLDKGFGQVLLEYDTSKESSAIIQVEWCGNDAIVLSLRDELKLIGPGQDSLSFFFDILDDGDNITPDFIYPKGDLNYIIPIIKTEFDGLRIILNDKVEFLSRVSQKSIDLYQIGSYHPSRILLDCLENLEFHPSKSDYSISLLKSEGTLGEALTTCLDVCLEEFDVTTQKNLLRAVSFGKAYANELFDSDIYLRTINYLKVLNQLRSPETCIFLTFDEVKSIGWDEIIDMLLRRDFYLLALEVIDLLKLQNYKPKVYINWCLSKIRKERTMDDKDLYKIISKKLKSLFNQKFTSFNYISVDQISDLAYEEGRIDLCKSLTNLEPSLSKRVQQLLKYDDYESALYRALSSADFDLSCLLLLHFHDTVSLSKFFKILNQNESHNTGIEDEDARSYLNVNGDIIENIWTRFFGLYNKDALVDYLKYQDKYFEIIRQDLYSFTKDPGFLNGDTSFSASYDEKLTNLINNCTSQRKIRFYRKEQDLVQIQRRLTETFKTNFFKERSYKNIFIQLIMMHQIKYVFRLAKEIKFSVAKAWFLIIHTYCKHSEFDRLFEIFSSQEIGPNERLVFNNEVGFLEVVDACVEYSAPVKHISFYIKHCNSVHYTKRIELYIKVRDYISASNEASMMKDAESLQQIFKHAVNNGAEDSILQSIRSNLSKLGHRPSI
ncbi:Piso0_003767 [Millerozyma farinosa CBS 7064]|uniref:Probable vacuolar protein sorting-associated protein 16 homolog n=1 Tax=Pichia sorbitophila (strain ATCC MYA-4447 / BCRC 22081 / CBS 7064 / NBRC 10061 / NRRL Y-12695) TaxID=559304 RepID=G8Y889_PICSO|nr:Piso0_003767 [Millerozyma farinosa CBS 7064]CCE84226.1 Piso0_003767 [Millerozyma farinosa CBS 7064]